MGAINHVEHKNGIVIYKAGHSTEQCKIHYDKVLGYDIENAIAVLAKEKCVVNVDDKSYPMDKHDLMIIPLSLYHLMV